MPAGRFALVTKSGVLIHGKDVSQTASHRRCGYDVRVQHVQRVSVFDEKDMPRSTAKKAGVQGY